MTDPNPKKLLGPLFQYLTSTGAPTEVWQSVYGFADQLDILTGERDEARQVVKLVVKVWGPESERVSREEQLAMLAQARSILAKYGITNVPGQVPEA